MLPWSAPPMLAAVAGSPPKPASATASAKTPPA